MKTQRSSVISLSKFILNQLVKEELIEVSNPSRQQILSDFENLFTQYVKSDEDLDRGIQGFIPPSSSKSEGEMEQMAGQLQRDSLKDNRHRGLYYLISIRQLASEIKAYLWNSKGIDEIFVDDDQLVQSMVDHIRNYDPQNVAL